MSLTEYARSLTEYTFQLQLFMFRIKSYWCKQGLEFFNILWISELFFMVSFSFFFFQFIYTSSSLFQNFQQVSDEVFFLQVR